MRSARRFLCATLGLMRGVRVRVFCFLTLTALGFLSCGDLIESPTAPIDPDPPDASATLTRVQMEIFTPTCAQLGCHDTFGQQSQLVLTSGRAYSELVNRDSVEIPALKRILPLDPARSYLYMKVIAAPGITGDRMPQGLPPLTDAQTRLIRDWIRRGAPND